MPAEDYPWQLRDTLDSAAGAIRTASRLTNPANGTPGLQSPADAYTAVAALMILHQDEPQLITQIRGWLERAHAEGNVAHESGHAAGPAVTQACAELAAAAEDAAAAERHLAKAQNAIAGLTAAR